MPPPPIDRAAYPVLLVDDEPNILRTLRFTLDAHFTLHATTSPAEALALVEREPIAVLVADQRMPGMTGLALIEQAVARRPDVVPILLTGYTDTEVLTHAINLGCIRRYIGKPFDPRELHDAIAQAIEAVHLSRRNAALVVENTRLLGELAAANERLRVENRYLRQRNAEGEDFDSIVGCSPALQRVVTLARKVADAPTTVLIEGATGTGKERLARAIHHGGSRRQRLFIVVNAGATPDALLASTFFGHRRGAFTGAHGDAKGLFETAHGGTIFLDEIGEASPALQVHLLRILEDGEVTPVGATRPMHVDVRVIAATNRDLESEVRAGRFREDLYHRLRLFRVRLPTLAEHTEDIPALAEHFVARAATKLRKPVAGITPEAVAALGRRQYPGNVRELENLIERAVIVCEPDAPITEADLCDPFAEASLAEPVAADADLATRLHEQVAGFERERIRTALERFGGNRTQAARHLGLTYRGLLFKLQRHGMVSGRGNGV